MPYLLDTNTCIQHLRGLSAAITLTSRAGAAERQKLYLAAG